jgi:glycosyltransferase involved in cell wall biosynthesis
MRISTIVPAYNAAAYLERAVESLRATGYADLEIIIVDDGSQDGTWDIAQRLKQLYPKQVSAFVHRDRANLGVSASRNLGIERSSGELVCFLDADDFVYPNRFAAALPALADPAVDAVYTTTEMVFATKEAERAWLFSDRIFGIREELTGAALRHALLAGRVWATSGILIRRSLLEKTGLFLTTLPTAEDCHLWWRMALLGNIKAGDLSRPTGAYFRHGMNSFQIGLDSRLAMLDALLDFQGWARIRRENEAILAEIDERVMNCAIQSYAAARDDGRHDLAWAIMRRLLAAGPIRYGSRPQVIRCVASLAKRSARHALGFCHL